MRKTEALREIYTEKENENALHYPPAATLPQARAVSKDKAAAMCMLITVVSMLGYLVENTFIAIKDGYIDNRNMFLPFLLGYGISIFVIYLLFGTPKTPRFCKYDLSSKSRILNTLVYFMFCFTIVSVGEFILGTVVEKTCGIVWWSYLDIPLHITKYTSVPTSAAFASMITLFMGCIFKPLYNAFLKMNKKTLYTMATVFMLFMTLDFVHSGLVMLNSGEVMRLWRIDF